jgi:hypothetical protein
MDKNGTSSVIDHKAFLNGKTMSFADQPYLDMLFTDVRNPALPLTIVVGAGVSMNAGLRSWPELVRQMTDQISDEHLRSLARLDTSDLLRRAEIIVQLIKEHNRNVEDHEIIRDALYQKDMEPTPGQLAMSIARLVAARRDNVKLITTNFDTILESALRKHFKHVQPFSLDEKEGWEATHGSQTIGVLHVHGVVEQHEPPHKPTILTESQFFRHGADVRNIIYEHMKDACSLFVGLSMSDPNLIGPIYEMTNREIDRHRFTLVVPDAAPGAADAVDSIRYAIQSAKFMERELTLRTVFLRSYSQLNQAISDLGLALVEPDRYKARPRDGSPSLVYGKRLARALDNCYASIGCPKARQVPTGAAAQDLNNRLYDALHSRRGPVQSLRQVAKRLGDFAIGGQNGENLALFLWLRSHHRAVTKAPYALNLVGTSAYLHREEWSVRRELDITRDSKMAAVQAVFRGTPLAVNVDPSPTSPIWQGIVAVPIVMESAGSNRTLDRVPVDQLTIGAITLNSTRKVTLTPGETPGSTVNGSKPSVITELDAEQMNDLLESVRRCAATVVLPTS